MLMVQKWGIGDWDNSDYLGDHRLSQISFAWGDNNYSPSGIVFGDSDGWDTDSEGGNYWGNRSAADDYRDSERTEDCEAIKVCAGNNLVRMYKGRMCGR